MSRIPGPGKFRKFLRTNKISIRKAADALHVTDPTIIAWRDGDKAPSPEHRVAIRVWTNGEVLDDDWRTDRERDQAANAALVRPFGPATTPAGDDPPSSERTPTGGKGNAGNAA
jgi:hypothetical protein